VRRKFWVFPVLYCECGCGEWVCGQRYVLGHSGRRRTFPVLLCSCGCGETLRQGRWLKGHHRRKYQLRPVLFCECGCAETVIGPNKFIFGHNPKVQHLSNISGYVQKLSSVQKVLQNLPDRRKRNSESARARWRDLGLRERQTQFMLGMWRSAEFAEKVLRNSLTEYRRGHYDSSKTGQEEFFQSSCELKRFEQLDADPDVVYWTKKHKVRIPYLGRDRLEHSYWPDLLICYLGGAWVLEEVKGWINPEKDPYKFVAAESFCKERGWQFRVKMEQEIRK